jgi:hypothetical protein
MTRKTNRDNEIVTGFERYNYLARHFARKFYYRWIPTNEDLEQAAALAAMEALHTLGEQTTLKELCTFLGRELYKQAAAYGLSSLKRKGVTRVNTNREIPLTSLALEGGSDPLEAQRLPVGVGAFTFRAARLLHQLTNLPDRDPQPTRHKAELLARMHQALDRDPDLRALRDWYLSRNDYFGYEAMQREGFCSRMQGHRLIIKARRLAGVAYNPQQLEQARRIAQAYYAAPPTQRTKYKLAARTGLASSTIQKYLLIAKASGLIAS